MSCGCNQTPCINISDPLPCGCPIQLDFDCVIYHKDNNETSALSSIGLTNGATLTLFAETVASLVGGLNPTNYTLPYLRANYTISTFKQFAEAVDTELSNIVQDIADAIAAQGGITPVDSPSVDLTVSGISGRTLRADVKLSALSGNRLTAQTDGLHITPQTLSVDYVNKTLTISEGNTVNLTALTCGVGGFIGNLVNDPSNPIDGQHWYNTTSNTLKIRVNGTTKTITLS